MRFPSINHITEKTTKTLKRFPVVLFSAFLAASIAIYLVELQAPEVDRLFNVILVSILGIPLFTVLQLIIEQRNWSAFANAGIHLLGILLLVGYYLALPIDLDFAPEAHIYRYMLYIIGVHLLVAIGPWIQGNVHGFWQYNKTLFLRFLTAVFFSGVLFAGLSIALLSINVLLDISIKEERYLQLFFFMGGVFNTWFFLSGIPSIKKFKNIHEYPKGLKIFTQNILIPLVVIYLGILYLYTGKIILQWSWPEGWVAILILSFSIAGILALLLLHPIQEKAENRWIKRFSRGYFWALVPLVILLLMAIYRRVWEYGVTVERYFVIILGFWLAGIVLYFLISKTRNIKVIPGSLCIIAFLISFGPWGVFSVSERSQINRLENHLTTNNILQEGAITKATDSVSSEDQTQISSIVHYLNDTHGLDGIQLWFEQDLNSSAFTGVEADSTQRISYHNRPRYVLEFMGLEYRSDGRYSSLTENRNQFHTDRNDVLEVEGVRWIIHDVNRFPIIGKQEYQLQNGIFVVVESSSKAPHIRIYQKNSINDTLSIDLVKHIRELQEKYSSDQKIPADDMTWIFSTNIENSINANIYFNSISWQNKNGKIVPGNAHFHIGIIDF